jgi:hypothetical protein
MNEPARLQFAAAVLSKRIMLKFTVAILLITGYFLVFLAINTVHFLYFPVAVVLYDSVFDAGLAAALFALFFLLFGRRWRVFTGLEACLIGVIGGLLSFNYAITVPAVIDRSLSIYILEKLAQRGGAIKLDAFPEIFVKEYMVEHRLVDIRLTEQLQSGTIHIEDGCVRLTPRGERISAVTRLYRTHLLPKRRMIMGVYTDDLTDPFRNSIVADYACPDAPSLKTK